MTVSPELLQKFNALKAGKVYYGEFARDSSDHAAVVVAISNKKVHYFCFTSQEEVIGDTFMNGNFFNFFPLVR